jgi:Family of unknown function (DUF5995)
LVGVTAGTVWSRATRRAGRCRWPLTRRNWRALAVVAALWTMSPARADHDTAHTIEQMTAHYQDPALEPQNKPFALLYLRATEGVHAANTAGELSDPQFRDTVVIPTFANYYLDAYAAWKRGDTQGVDDGQRAHSGRPTAGRTPFHASIAARQDPAETSRATPGGCSAWPLPRRRGFVVSRTPARSRLGPDRAALPRRHPALA